MYDPLIELMSNYTQKTLQTAFFSDEKMFKMEKLYNSHNEVVYDPKEMRKVEVPKERLFYDIEAFPKQAMASAMTSKAGKTSIFLLNRIQR